MDKLTYEFDLIDICVPDVRNRIDFNMGKDGKVAAVQSGKDEAGGWQSAAVAATHVAT